MKPVILFAICLLATVQVKLKPGVEFAIDVHNVQTQVGKITPMLMIYLVFGSD